jgi:hypothetical protein
VISREYGEFTLVCDICGEEIGGFSTFDEALDYKINEGWKSKRGEQLDLQDGYIDVCPNCLGIEEELV